MQLNGKWLQNWPVQVGTVLDLNCKPRTSQDCSLDRLFKKLIPQTFLMGNSSQEHPWQCLTQENGWKLAKADTKGFPGN